MRQFFENHPFLGLNLTGAALITSFLQVLNPILQAISLTVGIVWVSISIYSYFEKRYELNKLMREKQEKSDRRKN